MEEANVTTLVQRKSLLLRHYQKQQSALTTIMNKNNQTFAALTYHARATLYLMVVISLRGLELLRMEWSKKLALRSIRLMVKGAFANFNKRI
ncbi:hypothetical protein [Brucella pseudogrignonensis]|uniref:hypothetical protein n=1 Tax=Brucella pseudogrignonensis TaxID=419475 RepID=UPI000CFEB46F|nr:hypothetical protein [Brucella pseudogrignonensis]